jgi:metal-responsive CopG/Arc/MetJ family transcriptional regulator
MKTAISLPDQLFITAEQIADRLGLARSQLFARALEEFIEHHSKEDITKKLNEVYKNEKNEIDPVILEMQKLSIQKGTYDDSW